MKLDFTGQHSNSLEIADWGLRNADLKRHRAWSIGKYSLQLAASSGQKSMTTKHWELSTKHFGIARLGPARRVGVRWTIANFELLIKGLRHKAVEN